jgi:MFS family permease
VERGSPLRVTAFPESATVECQIAVSATSDTVETSIPKRLDRLPWARWHWVVVFALGFVWILDGLEVTIVGAIGPTLQDKGTLHLSSFQIGLIGAFYVAGGVVGALAFGYLTDRWGRKRLFMLTLGLYLLATVATAFSWSAWSFFLFRFLAGAGIGGEYSAINSAIDELIPARVRGWVDLAINGSWWLGTAAGALLSIVLLDPSIFRIDLGWRLAFGLGAILGIGVLLTRRTVPESPRWLMLKGRTDEAEGIVDDIERQVSASTGEKLDDPDGSIELEPREATGFVAIARTMFSRYRGRTVLGLTMMSAQAFAYNAVFFTYGVVLTTFMHVNKAHIGYYIVPFAIGNFLGPVLLGPLFDRVGRRPMLTATWTISGAVLVVTALLFNAGSLNSYTLTALWCVVFFFASAAASAAYLTVSEVFPLEIRAMAIAFFYAIGTGLGGIIGPALFGKLIASGTGATTVGFLIAAVWLLVAGVTAFFLAVDAEGKALEDVAEPLSATEGSDSGKLDPHADHDVDRDADSEQPTHRERREFGGYPARRGAQWSPRYSFHHESDDSLAGQVAAIERAVRESDRPLPERELLARTNARHWGPGVARRALRRAVAEGRVERLGNGYVAARTVA